MYIENIEKVTKAKYKVTTDEGVLYLYTGDLRRYKVKAGEELSLENYDTLIKETLRPRCRRKTLDILTRSDKTEAELREKLARYGYPGFLIDDAIDYANKYHYINDERVANSYIYFKSGRKSSREMKMELARKGVDKETIERLIEEKADDGEAIENAIIRKVGSAESLDDDKLQKLQAYLYRHGFETDLIKEKTARFREKA